MENTSNTEGKKVLVIAGVVGLIVLVFVVLFVVLMGNDEDAQPVENGESSTQEEEQASEESESNSDGSEAGNNSDDGSTDGGVNGGEDAGSTTDINGTVSNINDGSGGDGDDLVFPSNETEAGNYYCQTLFSPTNDTANYDACVAAVSCNPEPEEIAGNFTCKYAEHPEKNFAGGIEPSILLD